MIVLVVAALGVVATLVMWRQDRSHRGGAVARPLQWGALVAAVAAGVAAWPTTWSDSGAYALLLLGVPWFLAQPHSASPSRDGGGGSVSGSSRSCCWGGRCCSVWESASFSSPQPCCCWRRH